MPTFASPGLPLGSVAPAFQLPDVRTREPVSLDGVAGTRGTLVTFICRHCPYVKHVEQVLAELGRSYSGQGIGIVAISANDAERYPDDAPASLAEYADESGFDFPFLYDESQEVAKAYTAACTPDTFLFDAERKLVYRGQFDDTRPRSGATATGQDLRAALDALLSGQPISSEQKPSVGCGIKWKPGNEPS